MRGGGSNKEKGIKVLAWISFGAAVVGGAAIASTFVGDLIVSVVGFFPGWVAIAALLAGAVAMAVDLFVDSEPNRVALYTAMALPSVARAVPGALSNTVTNLSNQALSHVNAALGVWLGTSSAIGVALACVVVSLLVARRVIAKGGR
jgi:hypothetical protein